jgi:tRNA threonylcarbamoyladenosine biosynthesis protein TsaB
MLILAVDTSGRNGSMALAHCSAPDSCQFLDVVDLAGGTFSAQLVPQIAALLTQHGLSRTDIEGFAVASGPGSFTGLRIGLAAIKALGEILAKPIAAVSVLEVVGVAGGLSTPVLAATDAGRTDAYTAEYNGRLGVEKLMTQAEFLLTAKNFTVITPDTNVSTPALAAALQVKEIPRPRADAFLRVGWKKLQARKVVPPEDLEANYIRRSDAELFAAPK